MAKLLSAKELAEVLGVHEQTIWRWVRHGRIPHVRLPGGRLRFDLDEVRAALARQEPTAPPPAAA